MKTNTMENGLYCYVSGRQPAGRYPKLYLVKGNDVIVKFEGENIDSFCSIASAIYKKSGKWSSFTYRLALANGVRPIYLISPIHGTWGDELTSWDAVANKLSLPINIAKDIISKEFPSTAKRLDELEAFVGK